MAPSAAFVPVVRQRLSDQLVHRIHASIQDGQLRAGEQLPPIVAMAREFRVAAATVREALLKLEANRLVEIRHGSGVFIAGAGACQTVDR
jgi:GntR family transcriptional regulator, transcriptional repressor for pyruvate dehydrogenase complex